MTMERLEAKIGYHYNDPSLLETALTHSSYANEKHAAPCQSYERLEFLGDSILGLATAEFLYRHEPSLPEGRMTRLRSELVCEGSLHAVALRLGLGGYMRLGRGEERTGGRTRPSILADMVEAVIAAMYLDGGMEQCRRFIMDEILFRAEISDDHRGVDHKTRLQEIVQRKSDQVIAYELVEESGPDHDKTFTFAVSVNGLVRGRGSGRTKKEAEQMAAKAALEDMPE